MQVIEPPPIKQDIAAKSKRDTAVPSQIALKNPVSVLLNTLVTDRLSSLYESMNRGELSDGDFRVVGALMMEQLQQAVTHLEATNPAVPNPAVSKQGGVRPEIIASPVPALGVRQPKCSVESSEISSPHIQAGQPSVQSPAAAIGLGAVAKLAGAAALGGAFGYLLSSQSRSYPGVGNGYGYASGIPNSGGAFGYPSQNGGAGFDSSENHEGTVVVGFDSTGDGIPDTFVADSNADGIADFRATDDNGDGLIDSFESDSDGDGDFDQKFMAHDEFEPSTEIESDVFGMNDEFGTAELDEEIDSDDMLASSDEISDFDSDDFDSNSDVDFGGDVDFGD